MPERDIESLGVMGLGAGSCRGVLPPPPSPSPPQKWVFGELPNPSFSDTYARSRRATGWNRLVIALRYYFVFMKLGNSSKYNCKF